jgi:DNA binding domain, excisionase family
MRFSKELNGILFMAETVVNIKVKNHTKERITMFKDYGDVVTVEELCEMLMIGKNAAYELLGSGRIKAIRIGKIWKIPKKAVEEFVMGRSYEGEF